MFNINVPLLDSRFPDIAMMARRGAGIDEIGETLSRRTFQSSPRVRSGYFSSAAGKGIRGSDWVAVKREIHAMMAGERPDWDDLLPLLEDGSSSATLRAISTLSLRVAGALEIPVKRTTPLVAAALHAIASEGAAVLDGVIASPGPR